jgi:hypothetical protein
VVVGVLQEAGVDLHLAGQHRHELVGHVDPGRDLLVPAGQLGVGGDDPELLLAGEGLLPQRVPALVELAAVAVGPLLGDVVGGVGGARGEVAEERLVGGEVVALLGVRSSSTRVVSACRVGYHWLVCPARNP